MLRGIPNCLSPDLLKVLAEMGHGDTLVIGDAFYPSASSARYSMLVRADGVRATELLDAILHFFPLDASVKAPVLIMDKQECDKDIPCIGMIERFDFYKAAEHAYAVVATGETALYGCIILQKGTL